jgi:hypothetical protein
VRRTDGESHVSFVAVDHLDGFNASRTPPVALQPITGVGLRHDEDWMVGIGSIFRMAAAGNSKRYKKVIFSRRACIQESTIPR